MNTPFHRISDLSAGFARTAAVTFVLVCMCVLPLLQGQTPAPAAQNVDFPVGSVVRLKAGTALSFQQNPFRQVAGSEEFIVLDARPAQQTLYVATMDSRANEIAVSAPFSAAFLVTETSEEVGNRIISATNNHQYISAAALTRNSQLDSGKGAEFVSAINRLKSAEQAAGLASNNASAAHKEAERIRHHADATAGNGRNPPFVRAANKQRELADSMVKEADAKQRVAVAEQKGASDALSQIIKPKPALVVTTKNSRSSMPAFSTLSDYRKGKPFIPNEKENSSVSPAVLQAAIEKFAKSRNLSLKRCDVTPKNMVGIWKIPIDDLTDDSQQFYLGFRDDGTIAWPWELPSSLWKDEKSNDYYCKFLGPGEVLLLSIRDVGKRNFFEVRMLGTDPIEDGKKADGRFCMPMTPISRAVDFQDVCQWRELCHVEGSRHPELVGLYQKEMPKQGLEVSIASGEYAVGRIALEYFYKKAECESEGVPLKKSLEEWIVRFIEEGYTPDLAFRYGLLSFASKTTSVSAENKAKGIELAKKMLDMYYTEAQRKAEPEFVEALRGNRKQR